MCRVCWGARHGAESVAHLVLRDLHVEDDVVNELGQGFLHCRLELVVLQQRVNKLKDAEHQILKPQNLTCKILDKSISDPTRERWHHGAECGCDEFGSPSESIGSSTSSV